MREGGPRPKDAQQHYDEARQRRRSGDAQDPGDGAERPQRFTLKPFPDIRINTTPSYLVKGVLPRSGLAVVWGPPKCGKSFWTYDLVMHIALALPYRGRKVQAGSVVYLALEGGSGFANRVEAWRQQHLAEGADEPFPFYLLDVPIDLIAEHKALIAAIRAQVAGSKPSVVVVDTLNRAIVGDENAPEDMAKFIRAADAIRVAFDCLVLIIHHCGIAKNRPRGHTSLTGATDVQIAVERNTDGIITATVEYMKDAEAGAVFTSKLQKVDLAVDREGDEISSCVITIADPTEAPSKLSKLQRLAFDALKRVLGVDPPAEANLPAGKKACRIADWRDEFYDAHPADKQGTKQKAFVRAHLELTEAGLVEVMHEFAWLKD